MALYKSTLTHLLTYLLRQSLSMCQCFGLIYTAQKSAHVNKLPIPSFRSKSRSDIVIRFSDKDFLKESNNLPIWRRFLVFFTVQIENQPYFLASLFDLMTLNTVTCCAPHWLIFTKFEVGHLSVYDLRCFSADMLRHAVTLISDLLTLNACNVAAVTWSNSIDLSEMGQSALPRGTAI